MRAQLTIGALDDGGTLSLVDDGIAPFSSRGPTIFDLFLKPDLLAPGLGIVSLRAEHSTLDVQHPEARISLGDGPAGKAREPRHFEMSGSSMAAALVSGVVALMLEADPALTPDTVKARLMAGARRLEEGSLFDRGAGGVDTGAAMAHAGIARSAFSPALFESEGAIGIDGSGETWGDASLWSLEQVYGDPSLWDVEVILSNGFLDDPCVTGEGLIWQGRGGDVGGDGLIWQGRGGGVGGDGLIWQGRGDGLGGGDSGWEGSPDEVSCTSGAGLIWQGRGDGLGGGGLIWQGRDEGVTGDGLIWQGRKSP